MKLIPSEIAEVVIIEPEVFTDQRGFFFESWHAEKFAREGLAADFVQDNHSMSEMGTLRGLHYQVPPRAQGKLVRVVRGTVFDVAVDLRRSSPTFGKWVGLSLSAESKRSVWIPAGFAHGFYVMTPQAEVVYKCTEAYSPTEERVLRWDDPDLDIEWPLSEGQDPLLSEKDAAGLRLAEADCFP
jgi:dTDP-4-dehydrorhamnose 3,5-epimerase